MRRILAILLGLAVVAIGCGFLALGAFPPKAPAQMVHETISNDRLEQANAPPAPVLSPASMLPPVPVPASTQLPGSMQLPTPGAVSVPGSPPGPVPVPVPDAPTPTH